METIEIPHQRKIQSFVRREGRVSPTQTHTWKSLWPIYGVDLEALWGSTDAFNLEHLFGRQAPRILEIGFGDGQSLFEMAKANPDKDYLGIEVYRTGINQLLSNIQKQSSTSITNLRIICGDAALILNQKIPNNSFTTVQIFFSDPWPKRRHHKRRLIQTDFIDMLSRKIILNGLLHLATDWEDYAMQMMETLTANKHFQNMSGEGRFSERPTFRPITKYERRAKKLGHSIRDLIFKRINPII